MRSLSPHRQRRGTGAKQTQTEIGRTRWRSAAAERRGSGSVGAGAEYRCTENHDRDLGSRAGLSSSVDNFGESACHWLQSPRERSTSATLRMQWGAGKAERPPGRLPNPELTRRTHMTTSSETKIALSQPMVVDLSKAFFGASRFALQFRLVVDGRHRSFSSLAAPVGRDLRPGGYVQRPRSRLGGEATPPYSVERRRTDGLRRSSALVLRCGFPPRSGAPRPSVRHRRRPHRPLSRRLTTTRRRRPGRDRGEPTPGGRQAGPVPAGPNRIRPRHEPAGPDLRPSP